MPISGQTPLVNIMTAKEQLITYQPLLVAEFLWPDGTMLHLSSENLDSTAGGFQYKGHDYKPRITKQTLGQLQAVQDNGLALLPQITLELADADAFLWTEFEETDGLGFKGVKLTLKFIFWDAGTDTFSGDEMVKFVGICNAPATDERVLTVNAVNILNLATFNLPTVRVGKTCPWLMPTNLAERIAATNDPDSDFFECGYGPDVPGGVGNLDPATSAPFTECPLTREACIARLGNDALPDNVFGLPLTGSAREDQHLAIEYDQTGRKTGRFGGITWDPPESWRGREYISGNRNVGIDNPNYAKYTDYFPQTWGKCFVQPPVMWVAGDPNSTRWECVLGVGKIQGDFSKAFPIALVIVNDCL